jgi:hypothetical protein
MYVSHIYHITENSFCTANQVLCQYWLCRVDHVSLVLYYNGSLVASTVVSLTTAKLKHLIRVFSMSGFTLPYTANMFILMVL